MGGIMAGILPRRAADLLELFLWENVRALQVTSGQPRILRARSYHH